MVKKIKINPSTIVHNNTNVTTQLRTNIH